MISTRIIRSFLLTLIVFVGGSAQSLKVATLNVWTGLDYQGVFTIGEYETAQMREQRFQLMARALDSIRPDVIALQEANPAHCVGSRLAGILGYDYIYQRVNSGLKLGPLGIPWNLNEGLVILARKELRLEFVDLWDLSKTVGVFGNALSFHSSELNVALVGKIHVGEMPLYVVNAHLAYFVPVDSTSQSQLVKILHDGKASQRVSEAVAGKYKERASRSNTQLVNLAERLKTNIKGAPCILAGDFNIPPTLPDMQKFLVDAKLLDVASAPGLGNSVTWDPERNGNTRFSLDSLDARGDGLDPYDLLGAWYDSQSRRIDYVLLNSQFQQRDVKGSRIFLDSSDHSLFASDHYGVCVEVSVANCLSQRVSSGDTAISAEGSTLEPFPIVSYDTDVGFGYGVKAFYLNPLGRNESFDAILFNSTKGERWYRFVFSIPDFELRQGKTYPLAVDFTVDYDKYLKNSFFGVGNNSKFNEREYYTREPLEMSVAFNRGFTPRVVGQLGVKYKSVRNFNFSDTSRLRNLSPSLSSAEAEYHSVFASYRYDSRNSYINPSRGSVFQLEAEYAPTSGLTNVELARLGGWIQYYSTIFYPKTVFALRLGFQGLIGENLPVQVLLPIGGNQTLRGSPQDRYLDKTSAIVNAEIRFPVWWRFGGVLGYDLGKVWNGPGNIDVTRWSTNPVVGLRFFMETFVVRMDLGFGNETTGFYLNFGHLF